MKSKCTFILKATLALVLSMLMVFGTVATSFAVTVDPVADSAAEPAEPVAADETPAEDAVQLPVELVQTDEAPAAVGEPGLKNTDQIEIDTIKIASSDAQPDADAAAPVAALRRRNVDIAVTGAQTDLAETGWWTGDYYVYNNISTNGWSTGSPKASCDSDHNYYYIFYMKYADDNSGELRYRWYSSTGRKTVAPDTSKYDTNSNHSNVHDYSSTDNYYYHTMSNNAKWNRVLVGFDINGNSNAGYVWSSKTELTDLAATCTAASTTINEGASVKLTGSCSGTFSSSYYNNGNGGYKGVYTYQYSTDGTSWTDIGSKNTVNGSGAGTDSTGVTFTPASDGTYYVRVIVNDGNVVSGTNAKADRYATSANVTITVRNKNTITYNKGTKPSGGGTISPTTTPSTQYYYNGGSAITLSANYYSSTGYTQDGWATSDGGTKVYNANASYSANADKALYPAWSEKTSTLTVQAGTGGSITKDAETKSGVATYVSVTAVTPDSAKYFTGWTVTGTDASHVRIKNASGTQIFNGSTWNYGTDTTTSIRVYTDGSSSNMSATVQANFADSERTYYVGMMVKDDTGNYTTAKASAASNTGDGFTATATVAGNANSGTVNIGSTVALVTTGNINCTDTQNPTVNFTGATENGGFYSYTYVKYQFVGWKKSDTALTEISGSNTTWDETNASITPTVPATGEGYWYACYRKQYVFCAFRSYNYAAGTSGNIIFIASPPTKYQIGSAASVGYTEQGAKFAVPAGEDLKLTYTSLASSDCIDHVYYDDTDYTTATPTAENFNSSNQHEISTGISTDQSKHEVTITMTQNYKNIHIALGTKYKIFFSDYKNAIIHSKNIDDYYAPGEAVSGDTEATYLTVKASGNASQTNKITSTDVKFYYCDSTGEFTDASGNKVDTPVEIESTDLAFEAGDSVNTGATDGTARKITGTMPNTNVYVDLGLDTTYDFYIGSKIVSDTTQNRVAWRQVAGIDLKYKPGDTEYTYSAANNTATSEKATWNSGAVTAVKQGDSVKLTWEYWDISSGGGEAYSTKYMFVGWYKGDASGPFYDSKNLISEKKTFSYTPKANVYVWAVGTRDMYINGTMSITGAEASVGNWPSTNFKMKFDADYINPEGGARGRYYWEITEDMLNATSKPGELTGLHTDSSGVWIPGGLESQNTEGWNRAASNSYFRIYDSKTITDSDSDSKYYDETANLSYWTSIDKQNNNNTDLNWGKALDGDSTGVTRKTLGLGYINYNPTTYPAYSAPIRIYAYPGHGIDVDATPVYANLYISNGFDVGSTSKDTAVTIQPVKNGAVATGGDAFTITDAETFTPDVEGAVHKYIPEKKNATVRITKTCASGDKVAAFFVYDLDNDKVYSLKDIHNSGNDWYIDLTVKLQQNLYICPTIEPAGSTVTVKFDATQLNKTQWGDIVSCFAWYAGSGNNALGAFPGQPMIVSDDLGSWSAKFPETSGANSIAGITFSNYVDSTHTWLGTTGNAGTKVMSTVTYTNQDDPTTNETKEGVWDGVGPIDSVADDGLIKQYNYIDSGSNHEYSRQNFKAQTYDYREPIAIFKNRSEGAGVDTTITFAMKDGNTSLLSWRHAELEKENILNNTWGAKLNWEYLTNSTGNKYSDLNGQPLEGNPTATYYIAAKGGYIYKNGNVTAAFYSGKSYDTADHSYVNNEAYNTYNDNSYTIDGTPTGASSANHGWASDGCPSSVSYGDSTNTSADPNDVNFNYAVQWYVYDASGNFITTVLSSAFADMNTAKTQTYIKRELLDKGYAVDGKAVAICYDKPRYYYWDSPWNEINNGAPNYNGENDGEKGRKQINSGEGFAGYRFTGQWYTTVKTEPVTVSVKVGMITESGEIMAETNAMPYGSATASFSTVNGTAAYEHSNDGTQSVTVALADAEKRLVKLDAGSTNFIGWYYYDTNTGELEKASYDSSTDFFPNFNKDVTYYAMYSAAATYRYEYTGREGKQYYSVGGGDLTADELEDNKIDWGVGQRTTDGTTGKYDMKKLAPTANEISVFKRTINFSALDYTAAATYDASTDYTLDIGPFTNNVASFNLTYYYPTSKGGDLVTHSQSFQYNQTVDLQGEVATAAVQNAPDGKIFIGWYVYDGTNYGALLTQQANYGFVMTKEMTIAAKYAAAKDTDDEKWRAYIDDNGVTRELNTATSGRYYNDTIVRFCKGTDAAAHVPEGAEVGVLILNDGKTNGNISPTNDKLTIYANNLTDGATAKIGSAGKTVTKLCLTVIDSDGSPLTYYNRYDFALRSDYATTIGSKYNVYAYVKIDGTYYWSSVASGTYE